MNDAEDRSKGDISRLARDSLKAGPAARIKLYNSLLRRIADGERLSAAEMRVFRDLERDISGAIDDEDKNGRITGGIDGAAAYCGVSKRTIQYHLTKGTIRQNPDGSFDRAVLDNYMQRRGRRGAPQPAAASGGGGEDGENISILKERADLRYRLARAKREELLTQQIEGSVYSKEEVVEQWAQRVGLVTSGLNAWSVRLPPLLVGKSIDEMAAIIREEVRDLRTAYATRGKYTPKASTGKKTRKK